MDSIEPQKAAVGLVNFISEIFDPGNPSDCVGADQHVCPIRRNLRRGRPTCLPDKEEP